MYESTNGGNLTSVTKKKSSKLGIVLLIVGLIAGIGIGQNISFSGEASEGFITLNQDKGPKTVDWQILWDAIEEINEKYVDGPVDIQKILYGAISGAVGALDDPYSVFLPPKEAEDFQHELRGEFEGIGAEIAIKNERLTVVAPLDDSPAERAGIRAGDFIFKVDGEDSQNFTIEEAVNKIRGTAGTQVTLTVFHSGDTEAADIVVTRAKIEVKSLESEIKSHAGKRIGYIKLRRFGPDTEGLIDRAVSDLLLQNVNGIILDVRNNPGGFLDTAVEVASYWIPKGQPVVTQKFADGSEDVFKAEGSARLNGIPTVVLINGGSASASEIVAGALRDYGYAKLIGETSFGKGSVQELIDLRGGADLKLTIAKWLTPKGHDLNKAGLEPDELVELTDEDFNADRDPQLDHALELLTR